MGHKSRKRRRNYGGSALGTPGGRHPLVAPDSTHAPRNVCIMGYGPKGYEEKPAADIADIAAFREKWPVVWVDVDGLGNAELILAIGKLLGLPVLVLEDIFDVNRLPKIEEFERFIFLVLKNGLCAEFFETEQISIVLMEGLVLTIQEKPGNSFAPVRARIIDGVGKIRQFASDYLAYALIDAVIEGYYPILEKMKQRLDAIEDTFIEVTGMNVIRQIHDVKNNLLYMHSAIWPVRDITLVLAHEDIPIIKPATAHYLRDCQDQAKQVTELTEFYRLIASDLMNTYLAFNDNKANEIMKVLTMVSTIFIPLSFIASLYGMNFDRSISPYNMPELGTRYGYPVVLAVMLTIATGILYMFWRRGWFGDYPGRRYRKTQ